MRLCRLSLAFALSTKAGESPLSLAGSNAPVQGLLAAPTPVARHHVRPREAPAARRRRCDKKPEEPVHQSGTQYSIVLGAVRDSSKRCADGSPRVESEKTAPPADRLLFESATPSADSTSKGEFRA